MTAPRYVRFTTASGSRYLVDRDARTWSRSRGPLAAPLRTPDGTYEEISDIRVGAGVDISGAPLVPTGEPDLKRWVTTTLVVQVEESDAPFLDA